MISFNSIPAGVKTPFAFIEVDNSMAIQGLLPWQQRAVIFGQMSSAGTATANVLIPIPSIEEGIEKAGIGSMLDRMIRQFKANNPYIELYAVPIAYDGGTGTPQGTIEVTSAATGDGTLFLLVGGQPVHVPVSSGDTVQDIADAIKGIIADVDHKGLAVTCTDSLTAIAKLDYKSDGLVGNDLDVRANYYPGQSFPAGVAITITDPSAGSANPTLDYSVLLGDEDFSYIVNPFTDATNMGDLETELDRRFGPMVQIQSHCLSAVKGNQATLAGWCAAQSRNNPHVVTMGHYDNPMPTEEWAAGLGGVHSYHMNIDPARPLQTLPIVGILPPAVGSTARATRTERNVRLSNGMATFTVDAGGRVLIERAVTNYRLNPQGGQDLSYLDSNTLMTLMYIRYQYKLRIENRYPRHKLADNNQQIAAGQDIVRPKDIAMETIALFGDLADAGVIENLEEFKTNLVVERNGSDRNRVDVLLPADLVNQFRVLAAKLQFIL